VRPFTVVRERGNHFTAGKASRIDLSKLDLVMMRQDPRSTWPTSPRPSAAAYSARTLVLNDPDAVRNAPEKLFVTHFPEFMPPTLITSDKEAVLEFRGRYKDIIVKPLFGNGGAGVFHITAGDENLGSLLETFTQLYRSR